MEPHSKISKWAYLSHSWGPSCPPYGGTGRVQIKKVNSIEAGDTSNSLEITGSNHIGTHFDFPLHFSKEGENVLSYSPEFFIHQKILLFWLNAQPGQLISSAELEKSLLTYNGNYDETIVLIRSGASLYRQQAQFWENGPGLAPGVASFLRQTFKEATTVGIDTISVNCFQKREIGRKVHNEFLCHIKPLVLIEDMNLEPIKNQTVSLLIASPLRIEEADGSPCTVIAMLQP